MIESSPYAVTLPYFAAAAGFMPQGRLPLRASYLLRLRRLPAPVEQRDAFGRRGFDWEDVPSPLIDE